MDVNNFIRINSIKLFGVRWETWYITAFEMQLLSRGGSDGTGSGTEEREGELVAGALNRCAECWCSGCAPAADCLRDLGWITRASCSFGLTCGVRTAVVYACARTVNI